MRPVFFLLLLATSALGAEPLTFNEHIRPILSDNCFACHGTDAKHRKADLRLDTAEGALRDLGGYRALVPGDPAKSEVWMRIISTDEDEVMPPPKSHKAPLKPEQRALIKQWIEQGAVYQKHWAFEPVPPAAAGKSIDGFVQARLQQAQLALSPGADTATLLRRVTLDLTGLPPSLAEIESFTSGGQENYEQLVERLLTSPHFGEQMARPWLDAVRYADTHGMHFDNLRSIWPYRDWVVSAFNDNLPFDEFTVEQLAGDLLPKPTQSQLVASGYNRCLLTTNEGGSIAEEVMARYTSDRADTTAGVWLGLTTNCASCHDHKFDPLKQREVYQFGAFFNGLADGVWDSNFHAPMPVTLIANPSEQERLDTIAREMPPLRAVLSTKAEQLIAGVPPPKKGEASYEVVWVEDGDSPLPQDWATPAPTLPAGEWREGPGVPLAGGQRALRLEGKVRRPVSFGGGDVRLKVGMSAKAFAHVNLDPANPPTAISLTFRSGKATKRAVWGDVNAFGEEVAKMAIPAGPLPLPGAYVRIEVDAIAAGLEKGDAYDGIEIAQSGGAAWWDQFGTACVSEDATQDPLFSVDAWTKTYYDDALRDAAALPLDIGYRVRLPDYFQTDEDRALLKAYHRDFIFAPLRGALETEVRATRRLMAELVHWEKALPVTLISRELPKARPSHVLIRGQYNNLGDAVEPATPAFLPPLKHDSPRPTRLDLARWLVARENPLTPRVTVNRIWAQFFGVGLVRTPGDFGTQGDPPSHPALLDWLAADFMEHGWNVKRLVRQIVTSQSYRQMSRITPELLERDPANRLLARGPRFRLDGEVLRDQALALSGLLQPAIGGAPVRPYQPDNVWEPVAYAGSNTKNYQRDNCSGLYRRSLYTLWKRTAPPASLSTFDAPSRESFCTRRDRSNTPLQALALLNDVQQFEAARAFAERLLTNPCDDSTRLTRAFRTVTAREPGEAERKLLMAALVAQRARFSTDPEAALKVLANGESKPAHDLPAQEFAAWTLVANILFNLDETVTRN